MITLMKSAGQIGEYYGLSTDTKPNPVPNGSYFFELDTGDIYMFDAENKLWIAQ